MGINILPVQFIANLGNLRRSAELRTISSAFWNVTPPSELVAKGFTPHLNGENPHRLSGFEEWRSISLILGRAKRQAARLLLPPLSRT